MGNNSSGFVNEDKIRYALDNRKYSDLNSNLKRFIKFAYPTIQDTDIIKCEKVAGQSKCDLQVFVHNKLFRLSIKKGSSNSVHQEPVEPFISFLKHEYNISDSLANNIRFFIWGDKTLDGSGNKEDRMDTNHLKKNYPDVVQSIKSFFEANKEDLIKRFLLTGVNGDSIDFIYYGNESIGLWANKQDFLSVVLDSSSNTRSLVPVGKLSFQAWNRAINGEKSNNKRGVIQLKWHSLEKDLQSIMERR
ncbi:hypothetical protein [Alkaliphilus sp. B6464]|uniref:hypothetical protein n=1 Tax=Alkaliphilus sp. B6464 TaxID=2731219 RepID=UPI001BAE02E1|nr:hypothetical protein [Alkaliphilus sp. B6464]QUH21250.1 hypothetical protein HYG84_16085 [Alkaliphilus sp. B6464]